MRPGWLRRDPASRLPRVPGASPASFQTSHADSRNFLRIPFMTSRPSKDRQILGNIWKTQVTKIVTQFLDWRWMAAHFMSIDVALWKTGSKPIQKCYNDRLPNLFKKWPNKNVFWVKYPLGIHSTHLKRPAVCWDDSSWLLNVCALWMEAGFEITKAAYLLPSILLFSWLLYGRSLFLWGKSPQ